MRSPADAVRARARLELALRGVALALLVVALGRLWMLRGGTAERVHRTFEAAPSAVARDALAASARAGRSVTWGGEVSDLAASAEPAREPGDRWILASVAARPSLVRDSLGAIDSLAAGGGALTTRTPRGLWRVGDGPGAASVRAATRGELRRVAVVGRAGWEAKFVIAALEEEGWGVDARLSLGAQVVTQGDPRARLERHAAVVVLDSLPAADRGALVRYVRAGGGLVLAGDGARWGARALREIVPARETRLVAPESRDVATEDPLDALPLHALDALRDDATLLESRDALRAVVARREQAGRVVQSGFAESWRWRMQGEETAVRDHRLWWSRLVGAASATPAAPSAPLRAPSAEDPTGAPFAALVQALGPATADAPRSGRQGPPLPLWLGLPLLLLLVAEWASRRARGAV